MKKRILKALAFVLVAVLVCLVSASEYLLNYSLKPATLERSRQQDVLFSNMRRDYPQAVSWLDSMQQNHLFRDTFMVSRVDGSKLHAIYVRAKNPTPKTAVLLHGYCDGLIKMLPIGYLYNHDLDFNLLLMDHHAHGQSEGKAVQMGWLDRLDVLNWMKVAHDLFSTPGKEAEIVVHGVSMGGATTMYVSGEVEGKGPAAQLPSAKGILPMPYVKCFVEDCGYSSVWDEFSGELQNQFGLPSFPLMNLASGLCYLQYGWTFGETSSEEQVARCSLPMLFIHGDKDTFVPTAMVYKVYAAKSDPKELWITPGVEHALSYRIYPKEYTQKVKQFVGRYM